MKNIWIVDDDRSIRWVFEKALSREGLPFKLFSSATDALSALSSELPGVVVSDIRMPKETGLDLLTLIHSKYPNIPVIIMTAYSDLDSAVSSFEGGAFEYLPKPFDIDEAIGLIRRAGRENIAKNPLPDPDINTPEIFGNSVAMQQVFRAIGRLSQSDATVLINGETGTGKELVAQALHKHSRRANGPFVAINSAAIPRELLESELFGHERGAFTGAQSMRQGRFEQAAQGTLFLDEIGDMPADLQTRLLRVISDGHFYRVGGHQPIQANVRIIAATHQNLENRVKDNLFREDLFHRLNVIRLRLPNLSERTEDIPMLANHFLNKSAQKLGVDTKVFSDIAIKFLSKIEWPGNVRQLENMCHWVTVMAPGKYVDVKDLPSEISQTEKLPTESIWTINLEREVRQLLANGSVGIMNGLSDRFEKTLISVALEHTGGKKNEASQLLGIGRNTLTRKTQEFNLNTDEKNIESLSPLN